MKFYRYFLCLTLLLHSPFLLAQDLNIILIGTRDGQGIIYVAIYNDKPRFLQNGAEFRKIQLAAGSREIRLESVPPGGYAISVFHDENADGILNKNFFGVPMEGYGFSNNARGMFGPPSFEQASFQIGKEELHIVINIGY